MVDLGTPEQLLAGAHEDDSVFAPRLDCRAFLLAATRPRRWSWQTHRGRA